MGRARTSCIHALVNAPDADRVLRGSGEAGAGRKGEGEQAQAARQRAAAGEEAEVETKGQAERRERWEQSQQAPRRGGRGGRARAAAASRRRYFGFEYVDRDVGAGIIRITEKRGGATHTVELLEVFEYESSRKRMSVIARLPPALLDACGGGCPWSTAAQVATTATRP